MDLALLGWRNVTLDEKDYCPAVVRCDAKADARIVVGSGGWSWPLHHPSRRSRRPIAMWAKDERMQVSLSDVALFLKCSTQDSQGMMSVTLNIFSPCLPEVHQTC
jgi:hypothetical protein